MKAPLYDYAAEINRDRRRHALKKLIARSGVLGLVSILGVALGALLLNLNGHDLAIFGTLLLLVWGAWGCHFLTTRH